MVLCTIHSKKIRGQIKKKSKEEGSKIRNIPGTSSRVVRLRDDGNRNHHRGEPNWFLVGGPDQSAIIYF